MGFYVLRAFSANNLLTVPKLGEDGSISVQRGNTATSAVFATGRLAFIRGDVSIQNATLTIDNASSLSSSFLTMTATSFSGWDIPGLVGVPALTYSDLHGVMTVHAGASDRFTLNGTPDAISSAVFDNASTSRDYIYMAAWTKPLTLNGDFSLYLGGRLVSGNLDRIKEQFPADVSQHIGDTNMDEHYALMHGFEYLDVARDFCEPWIVLDAVAYRLIVAEREA